MGLLDDCKSLFATNDLYEVLSVDRKASEKMIKKAYKKMALVVHPDRQKNTDNTELANKKFQTLAAVTKILLDADLRSIYDEQGIVDDDDSFNWGSMDWTAYFNSLFPPVTKESFVKFYEKYRNSEKEREDLKKNYIEAKGDMDIIMESQMSRNSLEDEPRFREILENAIKNSEIEAFDIFVNEPEKKRKKRERFWKKEAKEVAAEEKAKEASTSNEDDLMKAIQTRNKSRQKDMNSFLDELEAKYTKPKRAKRAKK